MFSILSGTLPQAKFKKGAEEEDMDNPASGSEWCALENSRMVNAICEDNL